MGEVIKYHEVRSTVSSMARTALHAGERAISRLLVGRSEPTPKAIRDLGKTVAQARSVQLVIDGMNEYRPFQHDVEDPAEGFDLDGNFHHPRVERPVQLNGGWDVS